MNTTALDTLANRLGTDALTTLIRLCPEIRTASLTQQEATCAAMRSTAKATIDQLIDDAQDAPGVSHIAYQTAVLNLAHAGIKVLRAA
jgi:hypothetical protein